ncbi:MAG: amidohydrolase family protein [Clostridia bacterium]|nr:amidohydrolase family protein [Clostridia bacterium]
MAKTVIKCGKFFDSVEECVKENVNVVVEGNKIVEVTTSPVNETDATVYDFSGKFVMPGMIDGHAHIAMNGEPTAMDDMVKKNDGYFTINSIINAQADLMGGFTTLRDEGGYRFTEIDIRDAINAGKIWGPRLFVSGLPIGSTGGHGDSHFRPDVNGGWALIVDSPDEARKAARFNLKYGADQIKLLATGGVMSTGDLPGSPDLTVEEMKAALDIANTHGHISSAHAHGAIGIKYAIRAGITSIEHGMLMDDECIDMMAEHGTYLVPTIAGAFFIIDNAAILPPQAVEKANICIERHGKNLKKCREKGVKIAFGTDVGTYCNYHGMQGREFAAMLRCGDFSVTEALVSATKTVSQMMRWFDRIGSIEPGKFADIIAFDESPYDDITVMTRCSFVMKDGVVYKS